MHIFFDFDGTLVDSSEGIHIALVNACKQVGIKGPELNEFRACIGPPIQEIIHRLIPEIEHDQLEAIRVGFRSEYDQRYYSRVKWHQGVIEGLTRLHALDGTSLSIVTNKPTQPTNALLSEAGITNLFKSVMGVDYRVKNGNGPIFGSKKEAICYALDFTDCPSTQAVYVGDTISDQKACQASGVEFVAATYGFHLWHPQELMGFQAAGSFEEVVRCLEQKVSDTIRF